MHNARLPGVSFRSPRYCQPKALRRQTLDGPHSARTFRQAVHNAEAEQLRGRPFDARTPKIPTAASTCRKKHSSPLSTRSMMVSPGCDCRCLPKHGDPSMSPKSHSQQLTERDSCAISDIVSAFYDYDIWLTHRRHRMKAGYQMVRTPPLCR